MERNQHFKKEEREREGEREIEKSNHNKLSWSMLIGIAIIFMRARTFFVLNIQNAHIFSLFSLFIFWVHLFYFLHVNFPTLNIFLYLILFPWNFNFVFFDFSTGTNIINNFFLVISLEKTGQFLGVEEKIQRKLRIILIRCI